MIFGADVCPIMTFKEGFISGSAENLLDSNLQAVLFSADFRCYNLETPLADNYSFAAKYGPKFCAGTNTLPGIISLKPSVLTIGNNHITDAGEEGVLSTIKELNEAGISFFGAGLDIEQAKRPFIITLNGRKIGLITFVEHQAAFATDKSAGANGLDLLESFDDIRHLKENCDYLIVIYHGGKEYYQYPTPYLQKLCRKMVRCGADVVLCQHSHCAGCEEKYNGSTIVYGQGNFIFDSDMDLQKYAVLVQCTIDETNHLRCNYIPIIRDGNRMILATGETGEKIVSEFNKRSLQAKDIRFLEKRFDEECEIKRFQYVRWLIGNKLFIKIMDRLSGGKYSKTYYSKSEARRALIAIGCLSHREFVERMLLHTSKK